MEAVALTTYGIAWQTSYDCSGAKHPELRYMDNLSKLSYNVAYSLYNKANMWQLPEEKTAVVIATNSGPVESILNFNKANIEKGFRGINPATFPNVMLSTLLYRIAKGLKLKGPSVPLLLERKNFYQAVRYGFIQIAMQRCLAVLIVFAEEKKRSFGIAIECEASAKKRGCPIRYMVDGNINLTLLT